MEDLSVVIGSSGEEWPTISPATHDARRHERRRALLAAGLALFAVSCGKPPDFVAGQVWSYNTRTGEGASTVQVLHIERDTPVGDVIFVSVRALDARRVGRKIQSTEIWPLAFTRDALQKSVTTLQWSETVQRPYLKQLDLWWRDAREGKAAERTFSVPVKEALEEIEAERAGADKRRFAEV